MLHNAHVADYYYASAQRAEAHAHRSRTAHFRHLYTQLMMMFACKANDEHFA